MAVLHHATLTPTKIDLLRSWVSGQPWAPGVDAAEVDVAGAYRFDDPDGAVGLETFVLTGTDGALLQVPLTYRASPLPGAEGSLVGVAEHSVLGSRWVYDGAADEVYGRTLLATMTGGGHQAEMQFQTDTGLVAWDLTTFVEGHPGSGVATEPVLLRQLRPGHDVAPAGAPTLWGRWPGQDVATLLAWAAGAI